MLLIPGRLPPRPPSCPKPGRVRTSRCNLTPRDLPGPGPVSQSPSAASAEPEQRHRKRDHARHPDRPPGHVLLVLRQIDRVPRVREAKTWPDAGSYARGEILSRCRTSRHRRPRARGSEPPETRSSPRDPAWILVWVGGRVGEGPRRSRMSESDSMLRTTFLIIPTGPPERPSPKRHRDDY